jgi:hypothetical protein
MPRPRWQGSFQKGVGHPRGSSHLCLLLYLFCSPPGSCPTLPMVEALAAAGQWEGKGEPEAVDSEQLFGPNLVTWPQMATRATGITVCGRAAMGPHTPRLGLPLMRRAGWMQVAHRVIPATQEAEIGRIKAQSQSWADGPGDAISKNPSQKNRAGGVAQGEGPGFKLQNCKKKKKEKKRREGTHGHGGHLVGLSPLRQRTACGIDRWRFSTASLSPGKRAGMFCGVRSSRALCGV